MRNRYRDLVIGLAWTVLSASAVFAQADHAMTASSEAGAQKDVLQARLINAPTLTLTDESNLPDAPSAADDNDAPAPAPSPRPAPAKKAQKIQQGAPGAASIGSLGIDSRVATGKYWGLTAAMFGASIADAELTVRCQEQKTCSYVPPSLRSRSALYGIGVPADVGISYLAYRMKKHYNRFWYVPSAFVTGANAYVAVHAYHRSQQKP